MNQILTTEKKKTKSKNSGRQVEIKGIVRFFAIVIMIFGITLIGEGSYALYRKFDDEKIENIPTVTVSRHNDRALIYVEHNSEINKIIYSWNNGETTQLPEGGTSAQEEIILPNEDSILNLVVEDMKGKKVSYQKEFKLTGVDITKPTVELEATNGNKKMTITVRDETALAYLSYQWDDDENPTVIEATQEKQIEIKQEIDLKPGTRTLKVIAEDKNGNTEQIEKEVVATTSKPKVSLIQDAGQLIVEIQDEDGVQAVEVNLNGDVKSAQNINQKHIKVGPLQLKQGNNTINIQVTNISGYTGKITREIQY